MADELIVVTERIYSNDPTRPRYVVAYEGQTVRRSVLEALGYLEPRAASKARTKKDIEDKALSPDTKG